MRTELNIYGFQVWSFDDHLSEFLSDHQWSSGDQQSGLQFPELHLFNELLDRQHIRVLREIITNGTKLTVTFGGYWDVFVEKSQYPQWENGSMSIWWITDDYKWSDQITWLSTDWYIVMEGLRSCTSFYKFHWNILRTAHIQLDQIGLERSASARWTWETGMGDT